MVVERAELDKSRSISIYKDTLRQNLELYYAVVGKPFMREDGRVH